MRHEDWPERLQAYVESHRNAAWVWGQHDCAMFASGAVQSVNGTDPFATYRGRYSTEAEAERLIDAAGGFEALCTSVLGEPQRAADARPRRGDLVYGPLRKDGAEGLAVCLGTTAVSPGYVWRPSIKTTPPTEAAITAAAALGQDARPVVAPTGRLVPVPGLVFHRIKGFRLVYRID